MIVRALTYKNEFSASSQDIVNQLLAYDLSDVEINDLMYSKSNELGDFLYVPVDLEHVTSNAPFSVEKAVEIVNVLISMGGMYYEDAHSFISEYAMTDKKEVSSEFRFQGRFGFGGKFRLNKDDVSYVDYYPEHQTDALDVLEAQINAQLIAIDAKYRGIDFFATIECDEDRLNTLSQWIESGELKSNIDNSIVNWLLVTCIYPDGFPRKILNGYDVKLEDEGMLTHFVSQLVEIAKCPVIVEGDDD